MDKKRSWFSCAVRRDIVLYSGKMAIFVGTLLMLINHGDKLWQGQLTLVDWLKIGFTYLVPYAVSTWSCVDTYRRHHANWRSLYDCEPGCATI